MDSIVSANKAASGVVASVTNARATDLAMEVMRDSFNTELEAALMKSGCKTKLLNKEKYDAYVTLCKKRQELVVDAAALRRANELVKSYHQVTNDYKVHVSEGGEAGEHVVLYKVSAQNAGVVNADGTVAYLPGLIRVAHSDEAFDLITSAHVQCGHGGVEATFDLLKQTISSIGRDYVMVYCKCCHTCSSTNRMERKAAAHKPIYTKGFCSRGQVDLIDFSHKPDKVSIQLNATEKAVIEYKWILHYQDHGTKFSVLRPLVSKSAVEVAKTLYCDVFSVFGFPVLLQSDNGREFCNHVIDQLLLLSPQGTKFIHGRPRHPQTQGSVERANGVVKPKLAKWLKENLSDNWSMGLYAVQLQKNSTLNRGVGNNPYKLVFGQDLRRGLCAKGVLPEELRTAATEEQLREEMSKRGYTLKDVNIVECDDSSDDEFFDSRPGPDDIHDATSLMTPVPVRTHVDSSSSSAPVPPAASSTGTECPGLCGTLVPLGNCHKCGHCGVSIHSWCGFPWILSEDPYEEEETTTARRQCLNCCPLDPTTDLRPKGPAAKKHRREFVDGDEDVDDVNDEDDEDDIMSYDLSPTHMKLQTQAYAKMQKAGTVYAEQAPVAPIMEVGQVVRLKVPDADRRGGPPVATAVILHRKRSKSQGMYYHLGFPAGILQTPMLGGELELLKNQTPIQHNLADVLANWEDSTVYKELPLRTLVNPKSNFGKCGCKSECTSGKCPCCRANLFCSADCHPKNKNCRNCQKPV